MTAQVSQIGKNQRPPRRGVHCAWQRYHPETDSQKTWSVRVQERRIHLLRRSTLPTSWWLPKSSLENQICRQNLVSLTGACQANSVNDYPTISSFFPTLVSVILT